VVTLGPDALHDSSLLEHSQVVREQIGRHAGHPGQFARRHVAQSESVDDRQPRRLAQSRMQTGSRGQIYLNIH
jgi:hypothetical protein